MGKNSANLVIRLTGENIPRCYSEKFNASSYKEIEIIIPPSVTLKGAAHFSDGTSFTNDFILKVYPKKKGK